MIGRLLSCDRAINSVLDLVILKKENFIQYNFNTRFLLHVHVFSIKLLYFKRHHYQGQTKTDNCAMYKFKSHICVCVFCVLKEQI